MLVSNEQNKECKHRHAIVIKKNRDNIIAWQIKCQEKLLIEIDENFNQVWTIIFNMHNIYAKLLEFS